MAASVPARPCSVTGGDKLPAASGGPVALCSAIEQAVAARGLGNGHAITVRVLSPHALVATIRTAKGATLPDLNMAISDGRLTPKWFDRFAAAVAEELASAGGTAAAKG